MSEQTGRAGFHVMHTKAVSERRAILHEAMRELDPEAVAYWAAKNPNIVVEDESLNEAMVNDGAGGFRRCTSTDEVLEYGSKRVARLAHKLRKDTLSSKTGKMAGGHVTTTLIVSHLPKSMCVEVPNFYPRFKVNGEPMIDLETGEQLMRSRWIARDRDEAREYFETVLDYLAVTSLPGGQEAVLGYDIQHSESTPHIQIIADTFAPDEKKPDELRVSWSKGWGGHRDVRNAQGKIIYGAQKLREYHAGLKKHLISGGYDVQADFDEVLHLVGLGKDEYGAVMDARAEIEALDAKHEREVDLLIEERNVLMNAEDKLRAIEERNSNNKRVLEAAFEFLEEREAALKLNQAELDVALEQLEAGRQRNANRESELDQRDAQIAEQEADSQARATAAEESAAQIERSAEERANAIVEAKLRDERAEVDRTRLKAREALSRADSLSNKFQERLDMLTDHLRKTNPGAVEATIAKNAGIFASAEDAKRHAIAALEDSEESRSEDFEFGG